jgi:ASC-1-like (ASCH) protein
MATIRVKPKPGLRVLNPALIPLGPLPVDGAVVEDSIYWRRRIADGDVVIVTTDAVETKVADVKPKK